MAKIISKLSAMAVANAKTSGLYGDGGGLYLQVSSNGSKSWIFRFKLGGRTRYMGLGSLRTISLAKAREVASNCRELRLRGIDPIAERQGVRAAARLDAAKTMTFDECRDAYIAAHQAGWRNAKHRSQWVNTLDTYVSPVFGKLAVQAIDVALVTQVLEPIWSTKPETASRLRGRIERVLDWAKARGFRAGENRARWRGHLDQLLPARSKVRNVRHHAALPFGGSSPVHDRPSRARGRRSAGVRVCDPNSGPNRRSNWCDLGRDRPRHAHIDCSCHSYEGPPRASHTPFRSCGRAT